MQPEENEILDDSVVSAVREVREPGERLTDIEHQIAMLNEKKEEIAQNELSRKERIQRELDQYSNMRRHFGCYGRNLEIKREIRKLELTREYARNLTEVEKKKLDEEIWSILDEQQNVAREETIKSKRKDLYLLRSKISKLEKDLKDLETAAVSYSSLDVNKEICRLTGHEPGRRGGPCTRCLPN